MQQNKAISEEIKLIKGLQSSRLGVDTLLAAGLLCEHCQLKVKSEWKGSSSSSTNIKESDDSTVLCTPVKAPTSMRELVKLDWLIYMRFCVCRIALFDTGDGSNNNNNNNNTASSYMDVFNAIEDYRIDSVTSSRDKLDRLHSFLEMVLKTSATTTTTTTKLPAALQGEKTKTPPTPSSSSSVITKGCEMLLMYINNIIKYPSVPRYRRISTNNQSFCSSLQPLNGHHEVLSSVGFVKKGSHYEWEWGLAASKYPNLSSPLKASSSSSSSSSSIKSNQSVDSHKNTIHEKSSSSADDICIIPPRDEATIHAVMTESVELITALKDKPEKCLQLLLDKTVANFETDQLPGSRSDVSINSSNRSASIAASTGTTNGTLPDVLLLSSSSPPPSSSSSDASTTITDKVSDLSGSLEIASWNFAEVLIIHIQ